MMAQVDCKPTPLHKAVQMKARLPACSVLARLEPATDTHCARLSTLRQESGSATVASGVGARTVIPTDITTHGPHQSCECGHIRIMGRMCLLDWIGAREMASVSAPCCQPSCLAVGG